MRARFATKRPNDTLSEDEGTEEVDDDCVLSKTDVEDIRREELGSNTFDDGVEGRANFTARMARRKFLHPFICEAVDQVGREIVEILLLDDEEENSHSNWRDHNR